MEKGRMRGAQGHMLFLGLLLAAIHQPAAAFVAISVVPQGGLPSVAAGVGRAGGLQVGGFLARGVAFSRISGGARAGDRCGIGALRICGIKQPRLIFSSKSSKSSKVHSRVSKLGTKCLAKLRLRSNFLAVMLAKKDSKKPGTVAENKQACVSVSVVN